jgi:L-alanine-DL-glutamate epimerase-like enolase superfamily enzyme
MAIADGRMIVSDRPGLGITLSDQLRAWTVDTYEVGGTIGMRS